MSILPPHLATRADWRAGPAPGPPRWLLLLVLALVLGARVHYAWVKRYSDDADRGIAHLMSAHVAEGREWPVFFYGQAYMGSLEPILGAAACKVFGTSSFAIALGAALPAFLLAIAVWWLARALAGPWPALYAAAFMATAPPAYAAYMAAPRGGYAVIMWLNTLCLYLGARFAAREFRGERVALGRYALLGLAAGAAWWTSGIVVSALAAAALVLVVGLKGRVWRPCVFAGLAGFAVGAAPWLHWNLRHQWLSLSMSDSLGATDLGATLPLFLRRAWEVMGIAAPSVSPYVLGAALLVPFAAAAFLAVRRARETGDAEPRFQLAALSIFLLLFAGTYACSSFARIETLRYLLPLLPVLAVLAGALIGGLAARAPLPVHLLLLLLLVGLQPALGRYRTGTDAAERRTHEGAAKAAEIALRAGCDVVFTPYALHWANFASREAIPFVDPADERYAPYARRGLLSERPGWLAGAQGIVPFLRTTASAYESTATPLDRVVYGVRPPGDAWRLLPAALVREATTQHGADVRELLFDGNLATRWRSDSSQNTPAHLELAFAEPVVLCGLKFYSADANYPIYLALDGRAGDEGTWTELLSERSLTGYHWSGPAVYWRNLYYTLEARFPTATVTALRIRFPPSPRREQYRFRLAELSLLTPAPGTPPSATPAPDEIAALVHRLERSGIHTLLADRYVSDRAAVLPGLTLQVRASAELERGVRDVPRRDDPIYTRVDLGPGTALLVPPGAASATEQRLRAYGYRPTLEPTPLGTLLLITGPDAVCVPDPGPQAWFGDRLFEWQEDEQEALHAHRLYQQAEHLLAEDAHHPCGAPLLEAALTRFPDHVPALRRWLQLARADDPMAARREVRLRQLTQPAHPAEARFDNGLALDGVTVEPPAAPPGATVRMTYTWRAPPDADLSDLSTFVHFRQNRIVWQDDHAALAGVGRSQVRLQPYEMPLQVVREVTIPADAPPGPYDLAVGLVVPSTGKRVSVKGADAALNRSVNLTGVMEVTAP